MLIPWYLKRRRRQHVNIRAKFQHIKRGRVFKVYFFVGNGIYFLLEWDHFFYPIGKAIKSNDTTYEPQRFLSRMLFDAR